MTRIPLGDSGAPYTMLGMDKARALYGGQIDKGDERHRLPYEVEEDIRKQQMDEERITDPLTGGEKGRKRARTDLLPADVLMLLAEHYGRGAEKYADRNWEKGYAWSLNYGALLRHLFLWWSGEELDEDGNPHIVAVAWHAMALIAFQNRGIGTDDRPV